MSLDPWLVCPHPQCGGQLTSLAFTREFGDPKYSSHLSIEPSESNGQLQTLIKTGNMSCLQTRQPSESEKLQCRGVGGRLGRNMLRSIHPQISTRGDSTCVGGYQWSGTTSLPVQAQKGTSKEPSQECSGDNHSKGLCRADLSRSFAGLY